ncbi:hypothetical protein BDP81DRAFT_457654 [Colletotrichum phormii]|uniref:Uncharacterized protein n=1 Tax=Colletotrichum phormii TaxID=359342 RepID=A0AAJ0A1Y8_9PEZI|nr:uncharacterized protein BDP81DRAFT_457654 [Colletotrichum phormii]KAK1654987.1 hypothetical protein BDP81DRAFT_457654 [Colletotrichum phormii]
MSGSPASRDTGRELAFLGETALTNDQRLREPYPSSYHPVNDSNIATRNSVELAGSASLGSDREAEQEAACSVQPLVANEQEPCELCLYTTRPIQDVETVAEAKDEVSSNADLNPDGDVEYEHKYLSENSAVLLTFAIFFIAATIALPTMFYLSWKNNGLAETREGLVYLWRFGPTAALTLISTFWSRVDTQVQRYMPWAAYRHGSPSTRNADDYNLDYSAMMLPKVLIQAVKRRHYFVFLVVIISISLKTQIVLAPDLFSIKPINATDAVNIQVLNSLNTNLAIKYDTLVADHISQDSSPYHMAQAVANFRIEYPFGVTGNISYQTFKSWNGSRGTVDAPIEAIVDGYFTETQCLKLKNYSYSDIEPYDSDSFRLGSIQDLTLRFDDCEQPLPLISSSPIMLNLAAVLCTSGSWISRVKVIDNGMIPYFQSLPDEIRTPVVTNIWDFMGASVPSNTWNTSVVNRVLGPVATAHDFFGTLQGINGLDAADSSLYENEVLYHSAMNMSITISKLMVNKWTCLSMAMISAMTTLLLTFVLLFFRINTKIWYRDPMTIVGNLLVLRDQRSHAEGASTSAPRLKTFGPKWGTCDFLPFVLQTWARVTFVVLVVAIAIGLGYTQWKSETSPGTATIYDEGSPKRFLWTSLPALIMLCVALYIDSCDSTYRGLATFSTLSSTPCRGPELEVSFLDMLGIRAILHSFRARVGIVTLTQFLSIIFIFTVETVSVPRTIQLQHKTWFGPAQAEDDGGKHSWRREILNSLLLHQGEGSLTYPENTYDDIVFPILGDIRQSSLPDNTSVKVNISAAKLNPTCWMVPSSTYNLTDLETDDKAFLYLVPGITETFVCPNGTRKNLSQSLGEARDESPESPYTCNKSCNLGFRQSDAEAATTKFRTYAYGKYSVEKEHFVYFSMKRCKYAWVQVPTEVNLTFSRGEYLDPGSQNRKWMRISHPKSEWLDPWFTLLLRPFGRLPLEAFGDPGREDEVLNDTHHLYGFLAAQLANLENRIDITNYSRDGSQPFLPDTNTAIANLTRRRLVQNSKVTNAIIGILSLTAISQVLMLISSAFKPLRNSRLFNMKVKGLAPDGYNSMAATKALLQDSNAMHHLPEGAELMSKENLHRELSGLRFRMGWFWRETTQTRHYTIGVLDDEDFEFLGNKDEIAKEDALLRHPPE